MAVPINTQIKRWLANVAARGSLYLPFGPDEHAAVLELSLLTMQQACFVLWSGTRNSKVPQTVLHIDSDYQSAKCKDAGLPWLL